VFLVAIRPSPNGSREHSLAVESASNFATPIGSVVADQRRTTSTKPNSLDGPEYHVVRGDGLDLDGAAVAGDDGAGENQRAGLQRRPCTEPNRLIGAVLPSSGNGEPVTTIAWSFLGAPAGRRD
jgi:hypothetical protein